MFQELNENEIKDFFELIGEIECGSHINFENEQHINWLNKKITSNLARGVKYFSLSDNNKKVGLSSILFNERLNGEKISAEIMEIGIFPEFRDQGYIFVSRKPHELALWMNENKLKVTENYI